LNRFLRILLVACTLLSAACTSSDPPPETLDRETFVEVYVALRMAALQQEDARLSEADRIRILDEFQVTIDELESFAEVWGGDPAYMLEVWRDIEARLNVPVDSTSVDDAG
jgi:hypothetical protein